MYSGYADRLIAVERSIGSFFFAKHIHFNEKINLKCCPSSDQMSLKIQWQNLQICFVNKAGLLLF